MKPSFALIGPGKVGCAVGKRLYLAGFPLKAVVGRTIASAANGCNFIAETTESATTDLLAAAKADIILLATTDGQLAAVADLLCDSSKLTPEHTLIHFSGLLPAKTLRAKDCPAATISIHPLLPFADRKIAFERLNNCPCAIEGDELAQQLALDLVATWEGQPFQIPSEKKALYHTAACITSNFTVTLAATACQLLEDCGIDGAESVRLLQPLLAATLDNFAQLGPGKGLTGPIVRGDTSTVAAHLSALEKHPHKTCLYQAIAEATISLAIKSGRLSREKATDIRSTISHLTP